MRFLEGSPHSQNFDLKPLDYQKRGKYCWEGIGPTPVSGRDIKLLSAITNYNKKIKNTATNIKIKYYLDKPSKIKLYVRELIPKHFYTMECYLNSPSSWNEFVWPTKYVIQPLGINIQNLGFIIRKDNHKAGEIVVPIINYASKYSSKVNGYRFAFKVGGNAKLDYAIYQEDNRKPIVEQELGKQSAGTPFVISWNSNKASAGTYKLVVKGFFLNDFRKISQDVYFYHQPFIENSSSIIKTEPTTITDKDNDTIIDNEDNCPNNTTKEISKGVRKHDSKKGCQ